MNRGELAGQQPVARHYEEDPRLAVHHHQHHRWQRQERRQTDQVADGHIADDAQDMGQRLVAASQRFGDAARNDLGTTLRQFGRPRRECLPHRAADRLRADRSDRTGGDKKIEDRADEQAADQSNGHIALGVAGFLGRGRDRIETDIGEEDRGRRTDHADRAPAIGKERLKIRAIRHRQCQGDEEGQRRNLDGHEDRIHPRTFGCADDEKTGHQRGDENRRQIDDAALARPHRKP